eukprot:5115189-Amphidinium_carterae.1
MVPLWSMYCSDDMPAVAAFSPAHFRCFCIVSHLGRTSAFYVSRCTCPLTVHYMLKCAKKHVSATINLVWEKRQPCLTALLSMLAWAHFVLRRGAGSSGAPANGGRGYCMMEDTHAVHDHATNAPVMLRSWRGRAFLWRLMFKIVWPCETCCAI